MAKKPSYWRYMLAQRTKPPLPDTMPDQAMHDPTIPGQTLSDQATFNTSLDQSAAQFSSVPQEELAVNIPKVVLLLLVPIMGLFALDVIVSIVTGSNRLSNTITFAFGLIPEWLFYGSVYQDSWLQRFMPLVTHSFVHAGPMHLLLNSLWMVVFGTAVARRMGADGKLRNLDSWIRINTFFLFYFSAVIFSSMTFAVLQPTSTVPLVGASGGISALLGASMRFVLRPHQPHGPYFGPLASVLSPPILIFSAVYIGINLFTAVGGNLMGEMENKIAWDVHLAGYFFGLFMFPAFDAYAETMPERKRPPARSY